jgi:hypothetical protein
VKQKLALGLAALLLACSDSALPGTMLGTYSVVGTLTANTCGAGLGAPTPWNFSAQMSEDGTSLYWSWMDGSPSVYGVMTSSTEATITGGDSANVDGAGDGGTGPCSMSRVDTLQIELGSGSPPPTFTGSLVYAFSADPGSMCSDQLSASGGMYDTLPCSTTYTLTGSRQ